MSVEGGHHGGSWKVAYADFVTAMMAFFLLMWLLQMAKPETKAALATYFKEFSLFEAKGAGMLDENASSPAPSMDQAKILPAETPVGAGNKEQLAKELKSQIETMLGEAKDRVVVDLFDHGVRIQVVDKAGDPVFPSGSTELSQTGEALLSVVGESIKKLDNKISVEGHTDSRPFAVPGKSNWDLSTDRALAAWRSLEIDGVEKTRMLRVAGYAETQPFIVENPEDPRNRRISILVFDKEKPAGSKQPAQGEVGNGTARVHPVLEKAPEVVLDKPIQEREDLLEQIIKERYERPRKDVMN